MNKDTRKKLVEIIEEDPEDFESWTAHSIKSLTLCMLELSNDICSVKKQLKLVLWFLGSIIILIVVNLIKV